ncbi:hypothetical protein [Pseudonocardia pini]|uniref:hypothetical protein n=1 Tax=Pseudonocardia pini TaxID=2758030 RepID=UPI0015F04AE6|nr:hypothetical protein [Pseudonocardia pini]
MERKGLVLALWAIPVVGLLAAAVCLVAGSPVAAGVVAAAALLMVEPLRRFTVPNLAVVLDPVEAEELREIAADEGEAAAVRRLREMYPQAGLQAAVRAVRGL